jgi:sigma-B regulation protein RsbU (phosphoserine phosphatase)
LPKNKTPGLDYADALSEAIHEFSRHGEDVLPLVAEAMAGKFDADRVELWLWDEGSNACNLASASGAPAIHQSNSTQSGFGVVGKVAQSRRTIENADPASFNGDPGFAGQSGLTCVTGYPLLANNHLLGVLAIYTRHSAPGELLAWWQLYAGIGAGKIDSFLSSQQKDRQIAKLSVLFEATRLLNSTLDLSELLELILKIARTEVDADRASVFLVDHKHYELWSIVASGLDHQEIRIPLGTGVAGRVAKTGEIINVEDAYSLDFFDSSFDQKFNYRTTSLLCMPIRHHTGLIVGVVELLNSAAGRFSQENCDFLQRLSGHVAMALQNVRLHRDSLEKQRRDRELTLARSIHRSLLPDSPPIVPGYDIAVLNDPCFDVAGDYYDFLNLGPQSLLLVVADVAGKGISSALIMSNLQATLHALVMHLHSLEVLAFSLNEMLYSRDGSGKYLSLFLGLVDTRHNLMHYINAGHVPPILVRGGSGEVKHLEEGGTVIGLFPAADYRRGSVRLFAGDVLVCCTDGVLEIADEQHQEFGAERLTECVRRHLDESAQSIVDAVLAEVAGYPASSMSGDDKVVVVMKVTADGTVDQPPPVPLN